MAKPLRSKEALYRILADRLREEILGGHWTHGEQIPTEGDLVKEYGVSRATVRQALSVLEHEGFIVTRHGAGRFISRPSGIVSAGIEQLSSITKTIADQGHKPGMRYLSRDVREATDEEVKALDLTSGDRVLDIRREITADRKVVAFSHDVMPQRILPEHFDIGELKGSVFAFLEERCGIHSKTAKAAVRAIRGEQTAWKVDVKRPLFVLLDQVHYSNDGVPVLYSRTYFIEGRFNFTVVRTR